LYIKKEFCKVFNTHLNFISQGAKMASRSQTRPSDQRAPACVPVPDIDDVDILSFEYDDMPALEPGLESDDDVLTFAANPDEGRGFIDEVSSLD
jgi:hypothetical protein